MGGWGFGLRGRGGGGGRIVRFLRCPRRVREGGWWGVVEVVEGGRGGCGGIVIVGAWSFMLRRRMRRRRISMQSSHLGRRKMYFPPPPPPLFASLLFYSLFLSHPPPHISISHLTDTHTGLAMVPPRLRNQIPRRSLRLQFLPSSHRPRPPILGLHPPFPHPPSRWHRFQSPPRREGIHHNDNDIKNVFAYPRREAGVLRAVRRDGVLVA